MGKSCLIRSFAGLVLALALVASLATAALALGLGEGWWPGPTGWATIPIAISIAIVGISIALFLFMLGRRPSPEAKKPFRSTAGIVSQDTDAKIDADVIITAATLGFTATCIIQSHRPIQFDIDPKDVMDEKKVVKVNEFIRAVSKMNAAIFAYLTEYGIAPAEVEAGVSPDYEKGGVILGVYTLAGRTAPQRPGKVAESELSPGGRRLYDRIKNEQVPQYTGRGAYTGFVDNPNGAPIGPLSTARFRTPAPGTRVPDPHPRWLPPVDRYSGLWKKRKRLGSEDDSPECYIPWGLIEGDSADKMLDYSLPNPKHATNHADQMTDNMQASGMVFNGDVTIEDIAAYTHGMIQAIYKAYALGPSCVPYEIAVGKKTTKLASCIPCTLFMYALGYPPTSIHLGSGESWAPLYEPYNPGGRSGRHERAVIRDLNNTWYENCLKWLIIGLDILDHRRNDMDEFHQSSRGLVMEYIRRNAVLALKPRDAIERYLLYHNADAFKAFMSARANLDLPDYTVGGVLILDALTIHDSEQARIDRTLC